ncbi:MAG: hypothetical protein JO187_12040 [Acidobacteria bacterium]|nr:hypothetical protein [Acidobacteriota bacterium]
MPLRISPENDRPAEPVAATRPPAEAIDDRVYRPSYRPEPQPEKINVIL